MVNEAVLRDVGVKTSRRYPVAGAVEIKKGTYLWQFQTASGFEVSSAWTTSAAFVGFAHADKVATNTADTAITADKGGMYDLFASGAIPIGTLVKAVPRNSVMAATLADITSTYARVMGVTREMAANAETINVEVFA